MRLENVISDCRYKLVPITKAFTGVIDIKVTNIKDAQKTLQKDMLEKVRKYPVGNPFFRK